MIHEHSLQYRKSSFVICDDRVYPGYTADDDDWNGWAIPAFDFKTAESILACGFAEREHTGLKSFSYDSATDTFLAVSHFYGKDETEEFTGFTIVTPEGGLKVYAVGAYSWTWEEVESTETSS